MLATKRDREEVASSSSAKRHDSPPNSLGGATSPEHIACPRALALALHAEALTLVMYTAPWVRHNPTTPNVPSVTGGKVSRHILVDCYVMEDAPDVASLTTFLPCLQLWRNGIKLLEATWSNDIPVVALPFQIPTGHDVPYTVIVFSAAWCAPCQRLATNYDYLSTEYSTKAVFAKCDYDANPALRTLYGIEKIPTLLVLKGRDLTVVDKFQNSDVEKVKFFLDKTMGVLRLDDDF